MILQAKEKIKKLGVFKIFAKITFAKQLSQHLTKSFLISHCITKDLLSKGLQQDSKSCCRKFFQNKLFLGIAGKFFHEKFFCSVCKVFY